MSRLRIPELLFKEVAQTPTSNSSFVNHSIIYRNETIFPNQGDKYYRERRSGKFKKSYRKKSLFYIY
jgi:hypothetical protein